MKTLGVTHSVCLTCLEMVPAKIIQEGSDIFFEKFCPQHGSSRVRIRADADDYVRSLNSIKPAWVPRAFSADGNAPCPTGCGLCPRHEQHICMPIVEITSRCNLACPACLIDAGRPWDMTRAELARLLDALVEAERQVDILNFSGGEPLIHPHLLDLVDEVLAHPGIVRVSLSTNGLALLAEPGLIDQLRRRNVVISLQFDGFDDRAYVALRGRPLLAEKRLVLDLLREAGVSTSLTMTVARGVNDDQFPAVLDYFFAQPHLVSLMIQPLAFAGRGRKFNSADMRLTIPEIVHLLATAGRPGVRASDFQPLPCSHPLCFSLAFYLVLDGGGTVSLHQFVDDAQWRNALANRTVFGLDEEDTNHMRDMIYDIWSREGSQAGLRPCMSETVMKTLHAVLDEMAGERFDPRHAFSAAERRVKSIFIHAFQDADTFDLARVRRCCNAYPQTDGSFIPACVHNVLGRRRKMSPNGLSV